MKTDKTGPEKADQAEQSNPQPSDALVGDQVIHSLGKPRTCRGCSPNGSGRDSTA